MITRLEVDGFKSLRDFAVDLEPFTVLIGPNSAGKSNVLDALALLSRLASQPIDEAFKHGRGKSVDQFSRHGGEVGRTIRFAVEFLEYGHPAAPDEDGSRFRYELSIERRTLPSGVERLVVGSERLRTMCREEDTWIPARAAFAGYASYTETVERYAMEARSPTHTWLATTLFDSEGLVKANLQRCRVLDAASPRLGEPSERIDSGELAPDASNLPTILAELAPNLLGGVRADLVSLVPGIAFFHVVPEGDNFRLDFELSGGERMPARLVSAGTLRILALLTALRMDPSGFMLCIEEPENGIYPGRLRALLDLLQEATTRSHEEEALTAVEEAELAEGGLGGLNRLPIQILLTTHSPVVLAALRAHPQHLRLVDMIRRNGERITRARPIGKPGPGDYGRFTATPREVDALLQAVATEEPREIYLRAGVYAEGPSDYHFLRPLLDRLLEELAASVFQGRCDVGETLGIDAPVPRGTRRVDRIAAALAKYADECPLFVIHTDGAGDPDGARARCIDPGIAAARAALPDRSIVAVGCVPVREIEAWLLMDCDAFRPLLGATDPGLPADPEKEIDPKASLRKILRDGRMRPGPESVHAFFGEQVRLSTLRALPAFRAFETSLIEAIQQVAASQGHRS